jgi:hypothetical protein
MREKTEKSPEKQGGKPENHVQFTVIFLKPAKARRYKQGAGRIQDLPGKWSAICIYFD